MLEVHGLEVHRGGRAVVQDVTFAAGRGDVVALVGPSGAGKTTVIRAIAGLERLAAGSIAVDGTRLTPGSAGNAREVSALRARVGIVFQFHHLFAHMTALQNVWLAPVHVRGEPRADAAQRAIALLDRLGVGHRRDAFPAELSGGEAQRVAIARALAMDPAVLLMDEPTASLDPARRGELAGAIRQLSSDGRTVVVATHDEEFVRACARQVLVIDAGRMARRVN